MECSNSNQCHSRNQADGIFRGNGAPKGSRLIFPRPALGRERTVPEIGLRMRRMVAFEIAWHLTATARVDRSKLTRGEVGLGLGPKN